MSFDNLSELERATLEELDMLTIWLDDAEMPKRLKRGLEVSREKLAYALRDLKIDPMEYCRFYKEER